MNSGRAGREDPLGGEVNSGEAGREDPLGGEVNSGEARREDPLGGKKVNMKKQHWRAGNMLYPLPAVMVSCARDGEKPNIITAAWVGTICSGPAMVSVSIRPERDS